MIEKKAQAKQDVLDAKADAEKAAKEAERKLKVASEDAEKKRVEANNEYKLRELAEQRKRRAENDLANKEHDADVAFDVAREARQHAYDAQVAATKAIVKRDIAF